MSYKTALPEVFPYCIALYPYDIKDFVNELLDDSRTDVIQGSSFAVTVDNWDGTWNLWLSTASLNYLISKDLLPEGLLESV